MVWTREHTPTDALGERIHLTDRVMVVASGEGAVKVDIGRVGRVIGFARSRAKIKFADKGEIKSISMTNLAVRRRDGAEDHEGNKSSELAPADASGNE